MASGPIRHDLTGIQEVFNEFSALKIDAELAMLRAVETAIVDIAGHADEMVPRDEGELRASQDIIRPKRRGDTIEASISYGGPSAQYALVQHENMKLWHPPKPPGKQKSAGHRQGQGPTARSAVPTISNTHSTKKPKTGPTVSSADSLPRAWIY